MDKVALKAYLAGQQEAQKIIAAEACRRLPALSLAEGLEEFAGLSRLWELTPKCPLGAVPTNGVDQLDLFGLLAHRRVFALYHKRHA